MEVEGPSSRGAGSGVLSSSSSSKKVFAEQVVLPGDNLTDLIAQVIERELSVSSSSADSASTPTTTATTTSTGAVRLGSGLFQEQGSIICTKAGVLAYMRPNRFYVLTSQHRYLPAIGDTVVGVIVDRTTDFYRVRLHGTSMAQLPLLAFDGASKRNKPNLLPGTAVFARIAACSKHMEPELSCQALSGPRKDFTTGQSIFGELKGNGTLVKISTGLSRRLLDPSCAVLQTLGASMPFEIAVGLNGLLWVCAARVPQMIAIVQALKLSEHLDEEQSAELAAAIVRATTTPSGIGSGSGNATSSSVGNVR